mgnify:CR=1 FL=1
MKFILIHFLFLINLLNANIINFSLNLSQATYCEVDYKWDCKVCDKSNQIYNIITKESEKIIIGENIILDTLFVAFRGSSNLENWIDDAQFSHTCFNNNICIDKGFHKLYEKLNQTIIKKLNKHQNKNLLITGHSLGAALATLLTYELNKDYNISLVTFGSPRVGNKEFVKDMLKHSFLSNRVTHYFDIVPHLPQEILNYKHLPGEIWFNELNTHFKICDDDNIEDNECSNKCWPFFCTSISDHLNYLNISMGKNGIC